MGQLAMDPPTGIPQMGQLAMNSLTGIPQMGQLAGTPSGANPDTLTPDPPPGNVGVVVIRIHLHAFPKLFLRTQPQVPGVLVSLIDRIVSVIRHRLRIMLQRPPEVGDHAVQVVDGLRSGRMGTGKQDRSRAKKRFYVIRHIAKAVPYQRGYGTLASKPRKRRLHSRSSPAAVRNASSMRRAIQARTGI